MMVYHTSNTPLKKMTFKEFLLGKETEEEKLRRLQSREQARIQEENSHPKIQSQVVVRDTSMSAMV